MSQTARKRSSFFMGILMGGTVLLASGVALAQVPDADCFSGACGGKKGIPECPDGFREVGFVAYANSKADAKGSCETVVSCTNFSNKTVELNCRFYYGFFPIPAGGGPQDALCSAVTPDVAPGDTNECATDAAEDFASGGIFGAGDGNCPVFEGKGLVCARGGNPEKILCHAHLSCDHGAAIEQISVIRKGAEHRP